MEDCKEEDAVDWFAGSLTKMEGHWMLAHAGPGLSNTNCSSEVNWRIMKQALLGAAGKAGGGYNHLRTQSNLTTFVQDDSKASARIMETNDS